MGSLSCDTVSPAVAKGSTARRTTGMSSCAMGVARAGDSGPSAACSLLAAAAVCTASTERWTRSGRGSFTAVFTGGALESGARCGPSEADGATWGSPAARAETEPDRPLSTWSADIRWTGAGDESVLDTCAAGLLLSCSAACPESAATPEAGALVLPVARAVLGTFLPGVPNSGLRWMTERRNGRSESSSLRSVSAPSPPSPLAALSSMLDESAAVGSTPSTGVDGVSSLTSSLLSSSLSR